MTEEQPQLALELPEIPRRAPRRATSAQSAPNVKALDQLVDLTGAVANHSERVAGAATKRTAGGRSRRAKSADQAADLTEAGTAPGAAPAPGGDGGGEPGASGSDGAGGQTARKTAGRSRRASSPAQAAPDGAAPGQPAPGRRSRRASSPAQDLTAAPAGAVPGQAAPSSGGTAADASDQARTAEPAPAGAGTSGQATRQTGGRSRRTGKSAQTAPAELASAEPAPVAADGGRPPRPVPAANSDEAAAGVDGAGAAGAAGAGADGADKVGADGQSGRKTGGRPRRGKAAGVDGESGQAGETSPDGQAAAPPPAGQPPAPVGGRLPMTALLFQAPVAAAPSRRRVSEPVDESADTGGGADQPGRDGASPPTPTGRSGRRRGGSKAGPAPNAGGSAQAEAAASDTGQDLPAGGDGATEAKAEAAEVDETEESSSRRRRRRTRTGRKAEAQGGDNGSEGVTALAGSTRLEAKRQRRKEGRETGRRRIQITEAEFLARRESVARRMVVRERDGRTQIAVLEDGVLVEHYVARRTQHTMVGNVYLGRVQNVLPSMEAAFIDVGRGRNAVLYAGEVNWDAAGLDGQPRRIEQALSSGDAVMVQVTKDPIGHKGSRLTSQITLAGRYLVFVPDGSMTGISRKLPEGERQRLKKLLKEIVPEGSGVIVRTAAEGASDAELRADVERLAAAWAKIQQKAATAQAPALLKGEPDLAIRVVRDIFNADFASLTVSGESAWADISGYLQEVAPELCDRVERWTSDQDVFTADRIDEQLSKGMDRKVWLPSGGSLVIDRTEAMTVIDVNTGKFTGAGGTLEETVTRNNLEAAEEIVRQLRLRDIGGIIVIDFIDMVLESNRDLVLRRLVEALARDRTRHQVAEVTSLGLVQMTRKRVGQGLVEAFSEVCEACGGRGFIVHADPVERSGSGSGSGSGGSGSWGGSGSGSGESGSKRKKRGGKKHRKKAADAAGPGSGSGSPSGNGGAAVLAQTPPEAKATLASIAAAAAASRGQAEAAALAQGDPAASGN